MLLRSNKCSEGPKEKNKKCKSINRSWCRWFHFWRKISSSSSMLVLVKRGSNTSGLMSIIKSRSHANNRSIRIQRSRSYLMGSQPMTFFIWRGQIKWKTSGIPINLNQFHILHSLSPNFVASNSIHLLPIIPKPS